MAQRGRRPKPAPQAPQEPEALYVRPSFAAKQLGMSRSTIYTMIYAGNVPGARKIGNIWIIPKSFIPKPPEAA